MTLYLTQSSFLGVIIPFLILEILFSGITVKLYREKRHFGMRDGMDGWMDGWMDGLMGGA